MKNEGKGEELRALINLGKKKGYLTYAEINSYLPEDVTSAEEIDRILSGLDEMDIEVIETPREAGQPEAKKGPAHPAGGAQAEGDPPPPPPGPPPPPPPP